MQSNLTIYLCGPINGCTDEECSDWRALVKQLWNGRCLDPMVRDYRGKESENYREIVELDKLDIRRSDIVVVSYSKPSVGTSMEVLYTWTLGKPVVVICAPDANISPWLRYHTTAFVHSYADAVMWCRKVFDP